MVAAGSAVDGTTRDRVWFTWDKREQFEELERLLVQTGLEDHRHLLLDLGDEDLRRGQAVGVLQRVILEPVSRIVWMC
jgi:hypothetical protein